MNFNRGKMAAAAVLAATLLVVGGVTGYGLHRAGTVGQPLSLIHIQMCIRDRLFGVELRSEADCEYPLDMRRLGKKEACT